MPTHYHGRSEEELALNTFIKLTRSAESLLSRLSHTGILGELTLSQFGVLESLYHLGPLCQMDLGAKLLRSGGNITLVIDNLEKAGLVRRERDAEDRRRVIVSLTRAGQERISQVFPRQLDAIVEEMSVLSAEEQETLGKLCKKLGKASKTMATTSMVNQPSTDHRRKA
jgi:MarR family 2-MHQ and catechol resistance regulon transcriptional repressor